MKLSRVLSLTTLTLLGASSSFGMDIVPVFDASIANDPNAAAIVGTINSALALYEAKFTDDIAVKVYIQKGGGLGTNVHGYYWGPAGNTISALAADAKSADDAIAVSHLNTSGFGSVAVTSANGRALGMNTPGFLSAGGEGGFDGIINLNTDVCFTDHNSPQPGLFDLYSATAHELDEVLGTISGAGDWLAFASDLYRYDGDGSRSFSADPTRHVYFSLDGVHMGNEYNQFGRTAGMIGDWAPHGYSQTQDWVIWDGIKIDPGEPEFQLLDAIGYDRAAPVPEPASMLALSLGVLGFLRRRKTATR